MRILWLFGLALAGCTDLTSGDPIIGTAADVRTSPGDYVGYRVVSPCQSGAAQLGVIGAGTASLVQVDEIAAAGATLLDSFADLKSVWGGGGYGLVCDPGVGTNLSLDDWRDVDAVIVRAGAWLRDQNLSLEVGIRVDSRPVPDL